MRQTLSMIRTSLKESLSSRYIYLVLLVGIGISLLLAASAYEYPGQISVPPAQYATSKSIDIANFLGCVLAVFIASGSSGTKSLYEMELTKPIKRWWYLLSRVLSEVIFPLLIVAIILFSTQAYILLRGGKFHIEIFIVISLLSLAIMAVVGLIRVFSLFFGQMYSLGMGFVVVLFSDRAFRGALTKLDEPWGAFLYLFPDLQSPKLIASKVLYGIPVEWKYLLGPIIYIPVSLLIAVIIFQRKDL
ncbi:MAG: hypothetical protein U9N35_08560 [Euryarchaeota archaeon]|nr:hypothetical protein [Euryarchaeota archaeon]